MYNLHFEITNNYSENSHKSFSSIHFKNFHIFQTAIFNMKSQRCPYNMKALYPSRSRIYYKHIPARITHNLQYMRVPAYEYVRTILIYEFTSPRIIFPRISTYMRHQHLHTLTLKETMKGMGITEIIVVTIAGNTDQRLERGYPGCQVKAAPEVSGVPDLIDRSQKITEWFIKHTVSVRNQPYEHLAKIL